MHGWCKFTLAYWLSSCHIDHRLGVNEDEESDTWGSPKAGVKVQNTENPAHLRRLFDKWLISRISVWIHAKTTKRILFKVSVKWGIMFASSTIPGDFGESLLMAKVIYRDLCFHKSRSRVDRFASLGSIRGWTQHCNGRKVDFLWLWVYLDFCKGCFQNLLEGVTSGTGCFNNPVLKTESAEQQNSESLFKPRLPWARVCVPALLPRKLGPGDSAPLFRTSPSPPLSRR